MSRLDHPKVPHVVQREHVPDVPGGEVSALHQIMHTLSVDQRLLRAPLCWTATMLRCVATYSTCAVTTRRSALFPANIV